MTTEPIRFLLFRGQRDDLINICFTHITLPLCQRQNTQWVSNKVSHKQDNNSPQSNNRDSHPFAFLKIYRQLILVLIKTFLKTFILTTTGILTVILTRVDHLSSMSLLG